MNLIQKNITILVLALLCRTVSDAQQSVGIGTSSPDPNAALDIINFQKGVLIPRLNGAQQTTLAGSLNGAEKGMLVTDATTGALKVWDGAAWQNFSPSAPFTAAAPLSLTANNLQINPGTAAGDLLTWDGNNWVNKQPAVQHFNITVDNRQPYMAANYIIAMFGIFPSQNDATQPYIGEIYIMGCNFAPVGFALCDGSLQAISQNSALFNLIGTTYGGDGVNTFALPDLRGRVPMHMGTTSGTGTNYVIGQTGGSETKTFIR